LADAEQTRLLERTYTRFHRSGARLDEVAKKEAEINERPAHLGTASPSFARDEQDWFMELGEADPMASRNSLSPPPRPQPAARHGRQGDRDRLSRSSVEPFLKAPPPRPAERPTRPSPRARQQYDNDNNATIVEILALREESAKLLGFPAFAATGWRIRWPRRRSGAWSVGAVWLPAGPGLADRDALQRWRRRGRAISRWRRGRRYYAEKLRQIRANFDDAAINPISC